ncbi:MAG: TfoX/Sxy family protein [Betaproteobacteria bacterium]
MGNTADFVEHVVELMRRTAGPTARARAMFGGHGLYADGIIVGILIDDVVYLKTDDGNRAEFVARDLEPFVYRMRHGDAITMSYHRAPDEAMESPDAMADWLRSAMGAAGRAAAKKPPKPAAVRARKA